MNDFIDKYRNPEQGLGYQVDKSNIAAERKKIPPIFYFEFKNQEEKQKAAEILKVFLNQLKLADSQRPLSHGPDGIPSPTEESSFFDSIDPDNFFSTDTYRPDQGLKLSFKRTPDHLSDPEALKEYLLKFFEDKGIRLAQKDGKGEVYETLDGIPQA